MPSAEIRTNFMATLRKGTQRRLAPEDRRQSIIDGSPRLFRSHTLSSGETRTEIGKHFVNVAATEQTTRRTLELKVSRTVDFATFKLSLAKQMAAFADEYDWKLAGTGVELAKIWYSVESDVIIIEDEEDWMVCKDDYKKNLQISVTAVEK
jgi:hypothetical protein